MLTIRWLSDKFSICKLPDIEEFRIEGIPASILEALAESQIRIFVVSTVN